MIAFLSVETGIAPSVLLAESPRMLFTMFAYLRWRAIHLGK
jgi:hypothetical protein